jgi:hypothetical protein
MNHGHAAQIKSTRLILPGEQNLDDKMSYNNLSYNVQLLPLTSVRIAVSHVSRISRTYLDLLKRVSTIRNARYVQKTF